MDCKMENNPPLDLSANAAFIIYNCFENTVLEIDRSLEIIPERPSFENSQLFNFIEDEQPLSPLTPVEGQSNHLVGYFKKAKSDKDFLLITSSGLSLSRSQKTRFVLSTRSGFVAIAILNSERQLLSLTQKDSRFLVHALKKQTHNFQWALLSQGRHEFHEKTVQIGITSNPNVTLTSISGNKNCAFIQRTNDDPNQVGVKAICDPTQLSAYSFRQEHFNLFLNLSEKGVFFQKFSELNSKWLLMKNIVNKTYYLFTNKYEKSLSIKDCVISIDQPALMNPQQILLIDIVEGSEMDVDDDDAEDRSATLKNKKISHSETKVRFCKTEGTEGSPLTTASTANSI